MKVPGAPPSAHTQREALPLFEWDGFVLLLWNLLLKHVLQSVTFMFNI